MPRVLRRTPESEKAAIYSYRDLLRDSFALLRRRATANVKRMTSGKMSREEVLEMALAPAGGMLKVAGTSKLLVGLLAKERKSINIAKEWVEAGGGWVEKRGRSSPFEGISLKEMAKEFAPTRNIFKEALKVPEKEYGRIKDIKWSSMKGEAVGTKGLYFPGMKDIAIHPYKADPSTVWHEFTHARQWNPEKLSSVPGSQAMEAEYAYQLQDLLESLRFVAKEGKMSARDFYQKISPTERHARDVAGTAVAFPREFNRIYKESLRREVAHSKEKLHELVRGLSESKRYLKWKEGPLPDLAKKATSKEELMKKFSKEGLRYDAFTEPMPGYGYHQWTLYGEGPAKGATFATKGIELGEMEAKIAELIRKFSK